MIQRWAVVLAVLASGAVGCTSDPPRQSAAELTPEALAELKAKYPVLGDTPAPQPQPGMGAAAGQLPEGLNASVDGTVLQTVRGGATFYADKFEGERTASGIPFRQNQMVAAHRGFPFGTVLRVTNLTNGRQVNVRVVDRGPFGAGPRAERTIIDLSRRAATELGYIDQGRAEVRIEVLEWGEGLSV